MLNYVWAEGHPNFTSEEFRLCLQQVSEENGIPATDKAAADQYRTAQAVYLITFLEIEENGLRRPAYTLNTDGRGYTPTFDPASLPKSAA